MNVTKNTRTVRYAEYAVPLSDGRANAKDLEDAIGWAKRDILATSLDDGGGAIWDDTIQVRVTDSLLIVFYEISVVNVNTL